MSPINGKEVDRFVREEGEWVLHSTGMRCFCMGKDGQPDPLCESHDVTGAIYDDPKRILGLMTGIMQHKTLVATGLFLPGDAVFSPLRKDTVAEGDKITLMKPLPFGTGDARARGNDVSDRLTYKAGLPEGSITGAAIFCMDENKVRYREGDDFLLQDKNIVWRWTGKSPEALAPKIGIRYSVKYRAYIDWIAFFPPMERFSHGEDLGSKVMLRKLHLLAR